jgi:threonine/homoserine/homoserine lactone efflux protein
MIVEILIAILIGISLAAPVGPTTTEVIKRGINGFYHGFLTGLGAAAADSTYLLIVFFGLSILFLYPLAKIVIWIFGCVILVYLGFIAVKDFSQFKSIDPQSKEEDNSAEMSIRWSFPTGYLITVANPITIIFWMGIFGSYLSSVIGGVTQLSALFYSFFVVVGVILWFFVLSIILGRGGSRLGSKFLKYVSPVCGIILIAFGAWFGYLAIASLLTTQ